MVRISKQIRKQMEEMGILKIEKGRYKDMTIANGRHKSRSKHPYVVDEIYKIYQRRIKAQK